MLGEDVPNEYIEQVIAEADVKDEKRITYDDFLDMWRKELEDRQMNAWRGISKQRTVSVLAEEMFSASTDDEHTLSDGEISDYEPISHRLVSIAEIEQQKKKSSMK